MTILNALCSIPENIAWMITGIAIGLCITMLVVLGKTLVDAWKSWHEDEDEE